MAGGAGGSEFVIELALVAAGNDGEEEGERIEALDDLFKLFRDKAERDVMLRREGEGMKALLRAMGRDAPARVREGAARVINRLLSAGGDVGARRDALCTIGGAMPSIVAAVDPDSPPSLRDLSLQVLSKLVLSGGDASGRLERITSAEGLVRAIVAGMSEKEENLDQLRLSARTLNALLRPGGNTDERRERISLTTGVLQVLQHRSEETGPTQSLALDALVQLVIGSPRLLKRLGGRRDRVFRSGVAESLHHLATASSTSIETLKSVYMLLGSLLQPGGDVMLRRDSLLGSVELVKQIQGDLARAEKEEPGTKASTRKALQDAACLTLYGLSGNPSGRMKLREDHRILPRVCSTTPINRFSIQALGRAAWEDDVLTAIRIEIRQAISSRSPSLPRPLLPASVFRSALLRLPPRPLIQVATSILLHPSSSPTSPVSSKESKRDDGMAKGGGEGEGDGGGGEGVRAGGEELVKLSLAKESEFPIERGDRLAAGWFLAALCARQGNAEDDSLAVERRKIVLSDAVALEAVRSVASSLHGHPAALVLAFLCLTESDREEDEKRGSGEKKGLPEFARVFLRQWEKLEEEEEEEGVSFGVSSGESKDLTVSSLDSLLPDRLLGADEVEEDRRREDCSTPASIIVESHKGLETMVQIAASAIHTAPDDHFTALVLVCLHRLLDPNYCHLWDIARSKVVQQTNDLHTLLQAMTNSGGSSSRRSRSRGGGARTATEETEDVTWDDVDGLDGSGFASTVHQVRTHLTTSPTTSTTTSSSTSTSTSSSSSSSSPSEDSIQWVKGVRRRKAWMILRQLLGGPIETRLERVDVLSSIPMVWNECIPAGVGGQLHSNGLADGFAMVLSLLFPSTKLASVASRCRSTKTCVDAIVKAVAEAVRVATKADLITDSTGESIIATTEAGGGGGGGKKGRGKRKWQRKRGGGRSDGGRGGEKAAAIAASAAAMTSKSAPGVVPPVDPIDAETASLGIGCLLLLCRGDADGSARKELLANPLVTTLLHRSLSAGDPSMRRAAARTLAAFTDSVKAVAGMKQVDALIRAAGVASEIDAGVTRRMAFHSVTAMVKTFPITKPLVAVSTRLALQDELSNMSSVPNPVAHGALCILEGILSGTTEADGGRCDWLLGLRKDLPILAGGTLVSTSATSVVGSVGGGGEGSGEGGGEEGVVGSEDVTWLSGGLVAASEWSEVAVTCLCHLFRGTGMVEARTAAILAHNSVLDALIHIVEMDIHDDGDGEGGSGDDVSDGKLHAAHEALCAVAHGGLLKVASAEKIQHVLETLANWSASGSKRSATRIEESLKAISVLLRSVPHPLAAKQVLLHALVTTQPRGVVCAALDGLQVYFQQCRIKVGQEGSDSIVFLRALLEVIGHRVSLAPRRQLLRVCALCLDLCVGGEVEDDIVDALAIEVQASLLPSWDASVHREGVELALYLLSHDHAPLRTRFAKSFSSTHLETLLALIRSLDGSDVEEDILQSITLLLQLLSTGMNVSPKDSEVFCAVVRKYGKYFAQLLLDTPTSPSTIIAMCHPQHCVILETFLKQGTNSLIKTLQVCEDTLLSTEIKVPIERRKQLFDLVVEALNTTLSDEFDSKSHASNDYEGHAWRPMVAQAGIKMLRFTKKLEAGSLDPWLLIASGGDDGSGKAGSGSDSIVDRVVVESRHLLRRISSFFTKLIRGCCEEEDRARFALKIIQSPVLLPWLQDEGEDKVFDLAAVLETSSLELPYLLQASLLLRNFRRAAVSALKSVELHAALQLNTVRNSLQFVLSRGSKAENLLHSSLHLYQVYFFGVKSIVGRPNAERFLAAFPPLHVVQEAANKCGMAVPSHPIVSDDVVHLLTLRPDDDSVDTHFPMDFANKPILPFSRWARGIPEEVFRQFPDEKTWGEDIFNPSTLLRNARVAAQDPWVRRAVKLLWGVAFEQVERRERAQYIKEIYNEYIEGPEHLRRKKKGGKKKKSSKKKGAGAGAGAAGGGEESGGGGEEEERRKGVAVLDLFAYTLLGCKHCPPSVLLCSFDLMSEFETCWTGTTTKNSHTAQLAYLMGGFLVQREPNLLLAMYAVESIMWTCFVMYDASIEGDGRLYLELFDMSSSFVRQVRVHVVHRMDRDTVISFEEGEVGSLCLGRMKLSTWKLHHPLEHKDVLMLASSCMLYGSISKAMSLADTRIESLPPTSGLSSHPAAIREWQHMCWVASRYLLDVGVAETLESQLEACSRQHPQVESVLGAKALRLCRMFRENGGVKREDLRSILVTLLRQEVFNVPGGHIAIMDQYRLCNRVMASVLPKGWGDTGWVKHSKEEFAVGDDSKEALHIATGVSDAYVVEAMLGFFSIANTDTLLYFPNVCMSMSTPYFYGSLATMSLHSEAGDPAMRSWIDGGSGDVEIGEDGRILVGAKIPFQDLRAALMVVLALNEVCVALKDSVGRLHRELAAAVTFPSTVCVVSRVEEWAKRELRRIHESTDGLIVQIGAKTPIMRESMGHGEGGAAEPHSSRRRKADDDDVAAGGGKEFGPLLTDGSEIPSPYPPFLNQKDLFTSIKFGTIVVDGKEVEDPRPFSYILSASRSLLTSLASARAHGYLIHCDDFQLDPEMPMIPNYSSTLYFLSSEGKFDPSENRCFVGMPLQVMEYREWRNIWNSGWICRDAYVMLACGFASYLLVPTPKEESKDALMPYQNGPDGITTKVWVRRVLPFFVSILSDVHDKACSRMKEHEDVRDLAHLSQLYKVLRCFATALDAQNAIPEHEFASSLATIAMIKWLACHAVRAECTVEVAGLLMRIVGHARSESSPNPALKRLALFPPIWSCLFHAQRSHTIPSDLRRRPVLLGNTKFLSQLPLSDQVEAIAMVGMELIELANPHSLAAQRVAKDAGFPLLYELEA